MAAGSSTLQSETVTIRLPSGEEVDAIVPSGMSDDQVRGLMQQKHPEFFQPQPPQTTPPQGQTRPPLKNAMQRFWEGAKAGTGGENALNTPVDPQRPISTNPMIPGAGVYRDIKGGNYAGALGRVAGPAAELLPLLGMREPAEGALGRVPTPAARSAAQTGEALGSIPVRPLPKSPVDYADVQGDQAIKQTLADQMRQEGRDATRSTLRPPSVPADAPYVPPQVSPAYGQGVGARRLVQQITQPEQTTPDLNDPDTLLELMRRSLSGISGGQ